jgi:arsenite methyltransferase
MTSDRVTKTGADMADTDRLVVDPEALRASVREKYLEVAARPAGAFHFHTGRPLAGLLGYDRELVDSLPDRAVESFAGVANPLTLRPLAAGERVVDLGSGAGFDCFVAAGRVGPAGRVVGVDMTPEMLDKARETARQLGPDNVEFREGIIEDVPVDDGWADVVTSNGVLNLVADKRRAMREIYRVLRPGGALAFADIAVGRAVPDEAVCNIDLWTDCIAGGQSLDAWRQLMREAGFVDIEVGPAVDTFGGARGEKNARAYDVVAHAFLAHKPT